MPVPAMTPKAVRPTVRAAAQLYGSGNSSLFTSAPSSIKIARRPSPQTLHSSFAFSSVRFSRLGARSFSASRTVLGSAAAVVSLSSTATSTSTLASTPTASTASLPSKASKSSASSSPASSPAPPPSTMVPHIQLSVADLPQIAAIGIPVPTYARGAAVREGIVHIGVGGFHRAHLAVYIDRLMQLHGMTDFAICGVGLQPWDKAMRDALNGQDHLYTVVERSAKGSEPKVIGSINAYLFAPDDREAVIAKMAHPDTHIVSMTITESGYYYDEHTHRLQMEHADIQRDLDPAHAADPMTTYGFLYAALARRHAAGLPPFTVLSCDNMHRNGSITRAMLEAFARARDPVVADWIAAKGAFPNSMVDRITPQTTAEDKAALTDAFGLVDAWPVVTEPFMQWVIEDRFVGGRRPPFELVGVQVVEDVADVEQFEKHKLRLLNGSHSALGYPGQLAGFHYVHEVMSNPLFAAFVWQMMQQEVKPLLPAIPGVDIDAYCHTLIERFSNPTIKDQLPRICLNGSGKIPKFIMPSIAEAIWHTGPFRRLCFVAAAWFHYILGVDDNGKPFEVDDVMREELQDKARRGGTNPREILSIKTLFGDNLRTDQRFLQQVTICLEEITKDGIMKTLPKYID